MFFNPLWLYLKGLGVTLCVEVGLFALIISRKPFKLLGAACYNLTSHILLHLFFTSLVICGLGYKIYGWLVGEILVILFESILFWISKIIPNYKKALLWSFVFNTASIIVGQVVNLIFGLNTIFSV